MDQEQFMSGHVDIEVLTAGKDVEFFDLLSRGIREFE
jgi:hypothetical protein